MKTTVRKQKSIAMTVNSFRSAERALKIGMPLSAEQVAKLIEQSPDQPLPPHLRTFVVGLLRGKSRRPRGAGRKNDGFIWDFTIADAKEMYRNKLVEFRAQDKRKRAAAKAAGDKLPRAEESAHMRAAQYVVNEMGSELSIWDAKTLLNVMSAPMRCYFADADQSPPDDYDPPDHLPPEKPARVIPFEQQWISKIGKHG